MLLHLFEPQIVNESKRLGNISSRSTQVCKSRQAVSCFVSVASTSCDEWQGNKSLRHSVNKHLWLVTQARKIRDISPSLSYRLYDIGDGEAGLF